MQLALWTDEAPLDARAEPAKSPKTPRAQRPAASALPARQSALEDLEGRAERYVEAAHAEATRKAYRANWAAFERWCAAAGLSALPASSHTLELYLTHLAELGLKASTIRRARVAIGLAHGHAEQPRPDKATRIRALERGIGRVHGSREEGAAPLLERELELAVRALGHSPREDRDRAMLLLGFAGAFRSSDLAGLNIEDVTFHAAGLKVLVRKSKEDQLGRGALTRVPYGTSQVTCPVAALKQWLGRVGRPNGPLFRVVRGATIEHQRIHPKAVTRAVQRAVGRAGLNGDYSSHSLRAGLATSAYEHGATRREIQLHGRWDDPRSVDRYIRLDHVPGRRNIAHGLV